MDDMALSETLKLMFNLSHFVKDRENLFIKSVFAAIPTFSYANTRSDLYPIFSQYSNGVNSLPSRFNRLSHWLSMR
jgi:hypothetical protein